VEIAGFEQARVSRHEIPRTQPVHITGHDLAARNFLPHGVAQDSRRGSHCLPHKSPSVAETMQAINKMTTRGFEKNPRSCTRTAARWTRNRLVRAHLDQLEGGFGTAQPKAGLFLQKRSLLARHPRTLSAYEGLH
jgi:hypothetical protein